MSTDSLIEPIDDAIAIVAVRKSELAAWQQQQAEPIRAWVISCGFEAEAHAVLRLPGDKPAVLIGLGDTIDRWSFAGLPQSLPEGVYRIDGELTDEEATQAALGWALGSYRFTRYKKPSRDVAQLIWPSKADRAQVARDAASMALVRDLINTPTNDLGPSQLADAAQAVAKEFGATCNVTVGDALLTENYPAVHAVGRAATNAPRLIDIAWGNAAHPKITLVGKGVCFDTGGLDIKPSSGMLIMKKDMGGAAHALALGRMVMAAKLPVRLRVIIPAVENAIAGNAMRPLDVLQTRKGLTVEVGNTDAEGRLILSDALALACEDKPDLLIDFATLTGAARVALGPDLPAMFANDDALAAELENDARETGDPLWRLPLHSAYAKDLDSKIADLNNISSNGFAGAIYAALFMQRFVDPAVKWIHLDTYGWNSKARPGRPEGGEARNLFALYRLIARRAK
ncbi:leucyl aminopeptidase family protein [Roseiterribacter gracilis]|uniref:Leucyl aminopeptidase n=1 Tax=Roseiterribacter gracilis TaxID=2812848 RepID=A0A8S8XFU4_9PROT|nr:leucyl aminopeptidase [Rhodospirillales bacterium TMPK1]